MLTVTTVCCYAQENMLYQTTHSTLITVEHKLVVDFYCVLNLLFLTSIAKFSFRALHGRGHTLILSHPFTIMPNGHVLQTLLSHPPPPKFLDQPLIMHAAHVT